MQEILGPRGEREREGESPRRLDRSGDALDGVGEIVDRLLGAPARILDRAAAEPGLGRQLDGERDAGGRIGVAVLEVGRHRQRRGVDDRAGMRQRLVAGDRAIGAAETEGAAGAGGGERLETETGQDARRADIVGIGDHERAWPLVQRPKCAGRVAPARSHAGSPSGLREDRCGTDLPLA